MPFQGQQIQTQPFQQLYLHPKTGQQTHLYVGYQTPPYSSTEVPYYQNPPYLGMKVLVSKAIPSYPSRLPLDFNRKFPFVATLELPHLT